MIEFDIPLEDLGLKKKSRTLNDVMTQTSDMVPLSPIVPAGNIL